MYTNKHYPKVLIVGETFRKDTGGGITLINLFSNWPKEQIAVVSDQNRYSNNKINATYYQLGVDEIKKGSLCPFIKTYEKSGVIVPTKNEKPPHSTKQYSKRPSPFIISIKYCIVSFAIRFKVSDSLLAFVRQIKPDLIYIQPNSFGYALLAKELIAKHPFKKIVVHFMDDFKFYYYPKKSLLLKGFFKWHLSILKTIVNKADNCFGISPKMCTEYAFLFGKNFYTFHNPVCIGEWSNIKEPPETDNELKTIKIVYSGRIGVANFTAIIEIIDAIEELNKRSSIDYYLEIYSPDKPIEILNRIYHSNHITYRGFQSQAFLVDIINSAQIVLLPLSFDKEAINRSYLSMPTKTSECLACSAAILIYAPLDTALVEYALAKGFGYVIRSQGIENIIEGLISLSDADVRIKYNKVALKIATSFHSLEKVSSDFEEMLLK